MGSVEWPMVKIVRVLSYLGVSMGFPQYEF